MIGAIRMMILITLGILSFIDFFGMIWQTYSNKLKAAEQL